MAYNAQIKKLCDEGKFQEAIEMAKIDYFRDRNDKWCKINVGLAFYKTINDRIGNKDYSRAKNYLTEFDSFNIVDENIERVRPLVDPEKSIILEARKESKSGNHDKAFELFKEAYKQFPDDKAVNEGLGWEIKRKIDVLVNNFDEVKLKEIRFLLNDFLKLNLKKPSNLYSSILFQVERISDSFDKYPYFVKAWGLENLNTEQSNSHLE